MKHITLRYRNDFLELPILTFGTGSVGREISYDDFALLLKQYHQHGGTCIDTGRMYAGGKSEELIGRYLSDGKCRQEFVLSSKGGFPDLSAKDSCRITPRELSKDLETSLQLLKTDYLDLYFLHRDHAQVQLEKLMPFLDNLVREGKVRFLGVSNWSHQRITLANQFAKEHHLTPFSISQIQWSLAESTPAMWNDPTIVTMTSEAFEFYRQSGIPVMAYSPLTRGFFSKAILSGYTEEFLTAYQPFLTPKNSLRITRIRELAQLLHATPTQICHAYIYSSGIPATAVMGCKNSRHLADSLDGARLHLTKEQISYLNGA